MNELKTVVVRCEEWPVGLVSASEIATQVGLPVERVLNLADAGYWPHYRFDGGAPMFHKTESKKWAARHLMQRVEGQTPDFQFKVIIQATQQIKTVPPESISQVKGLTELTDILYPPGVYFLVEGDEVVYVGQSVNPAARIGDHMKNKMGKFERAYFIPVPQFMLDAVEGGFIKLLSPKLNGNPGPKAGEYVELARQIHPALYGSQE